MVLQSKKYYRLCENIFKNNGLLKFKYTDYIYEINYENLINNRSDETKKLFSFCSLDWSEDIFNYYKTGKTIRTASLYQVKKPMYKSSLNVSKNYTNYLTFK